jgi:ketosteroid isomerase-like protein
MPSEPKEVAREAWDAWQRGDVDRVFEVFDPAIEWDTTHFEPWPEDELYQGQAEVRHFLEQWLASWKGYEAGVADFIEAGDRVVALCWQRGVGVGSGVPVDQEWAQVLTVRDGKVVRVDNYSVPAEAFEAVGLEEPAR